MRIDVKDFGDQRKELTMKYGCKGGQGRDSATITENMIAVFVCIIGFAAVIVAAGGVG